MRKGTLSKCSLAGLLALAALVSCVREAGGPVGDGESRIPIRLSGGIEQPFTTRASDSGFANGDAIGIYVVDYDGGAPGTLLAAGNRADNLRYTFDEAAWVWNPDHEVYWKDGNTHIDVYGYYPYVEGYPESVTALPFEVRADQDADAASGGLGGYEASDFLWGKAADNAPTDRTIQLKMKHILSGVRVSLVEGSGFGSGEWARLEKSVLLETAIRTATIDLSSGVATPTGSRPARGTSAAYNGSDWRCVVVPQTIPAGEVLFKITVGGISYSVSKDAAFTFQPSRLVHFTWRVNKREDSGLEFVFETESISAWEEESFSHQANAREYIIVDVPKPGTLSDCLSRAGYSLNEVASLKVTGTIDRRDFESMKGMASLKDLNLKEVTIVSYEDSPADVIPNSAFQEKQSLLSVILPDRLVEIGENAFFRCNLTGSLIIPEGVEVVGKGAFSCNNQLNGKLSLPSSLKRIGVAEGEMSSSDGGAFNDCGFIGQLMIPEGVTEIGIGSFSGCTGFSGELRLPHKLQKLGHSAFSHCTGLSGSLEIPQTLTEIPNKAFDEMGLSGTLTLHEGITRIGENAFAYTRFKGSLLLPPLLTTIEPGAFDNCDFSGELILPEGLTRIGSQAFRGNWRLMGTLEIPGDVISIGDNAFAGCGSLEGVIFPAGLETIRNGAFAECYGLGRIVCMGTVPPVLHGAPFEGVPKDNFTLEVPEAKIEDYQAAYGWSDFKRIAPYRNFVIRPMKASALNMSVTRDLVLTADGPWEIKSKPDWVSLDKNEGSGKTEIKLTFSALPRGAADCREGEVVFKMKEKAWETTLSVSQYDFAYDEDEVVTLQSATEGNGINIVILGDGYDAKEIHDGRLMEDMNQAMEHFFGLEPYITYRNYFQVYTAVAVSAESGVGTVNTIVHNRFNSTTKDGVVVGGRNGVSDIDMIRDYVCQAPTIDTDNLGDALVIMIPNTTDYGGICYWLGDGMSLAYCPKSDLGYPTDWRGAIQHEAGGHGFGHLGDEYIYHNAFIDACDCSCCAHTFSHDGDYFMNLSLTGKMSEVPWSHLIFHEKYRDFVDVFEGGFMHSRGVYRSEQNSCMNNDIPYYSTISREYIVRRIKRLAGETFSFEDFVEKDVIAVGTETRSAFQLPDYQPRNRRHAAPVWIDSYTKNKNSHHE